MTTLIILVILFAIAIIGLIIISIKRFSDKTDYILAGISLLTTKLDNIEKSQQDNFSKIILDIDKGIKAEASNISNLLSAIGAANKNIMGSMDVSNRAFVNSINAIEENNDNIIKSLGEINKFNNNHRRCTEVINNKVIEIKNEQGTLKQTISNIEAGNSSRHANVLNALKEIKNIVVDFNNNAPKSEDIIDSDELVNRIAEGICNKLIVISEIDSVLKNLYDKINIIVAQVCSKTESIEIPDTLINSIAEEISKKLIEIQAKNTLPTDKVKKPSPAKSKHRTRAKKADNSYNSVQDVSQQNISEN